MRLRGLVLFLALMVGSAVTAPAVAAAPATSGTLCNYIYPYPGESVGMCYQIVGTGLSVDSFKFGARQTGYTFDICVNFTLSGPNNYLIKGLSACGLRWGDPMYWQWFKPATRTMPAGSYCLTGYTDFGLYVGRECATVHS